LPSAELYAQVPVFNFSSLGAVIGGVLNIVRQLLSEAMKMMDCL
jgi:hypothetical protein